MLAVVPLDETGNPACRGASHRRPVVRMEDETFQIDLAVSARLRDERRADVGRLALGDAPPDDAAAPHVHDEGAGGRTPRTVVGSQVMSQLMTWFGPVPSGAPGKRG